MFTNSIILDTDSYKFSHYLQYPPGATNVSSYIESRGGKYSETCFFGLQAWIKKVLLNPITQEKIDFANEIANEHGFKDFNKTGWQYILEKYQGYLPLSISAVKEGSVIPTGNILLQVYNTDSKLAWLTSYIETSLLRGIWYPTTVCTRSRHIKKIIKSFLDQTADSTAGLPFKLHDFGYRGVSSQESGSLGGMAHLVNFQGTDTVGALIAARRFYYSGMAGFSIPAAEHSTITAWGRDFEKEAYENMIDKFCKNPGDMVAVVSDSYNIYEACEKIWGDSLKEKLENCGGTVIIRPDSGKPSTVVMKVLEILNSKFECSYNSKNYKMLPPYIRLIQGDGVNENSITEILYKMQINGWSADNIAFGMGGEMLQSMNRDTQKFAMKASAISFDGTKTWKPVNKNPVDDIVKISKKGRLDLIKNGDRFETLTVEDAALMKKPSLLELVYENGKVIRDQTFSQIRKFAEI